MRKGNNNWILWLWYENEEIKNRKITSEILYSWRDKEWQSSNLHCDRNSSDEVIVIYENC